MPVFGTPGERIGYELYPHPEGAPPILLIHGFTASRASFEANLVALREHFTVITVELLGHGDSDAPANPAAYRPQVAVQRVLQLCEHLGYQRVLLCGHSLGGALALRIALDAPEWVAGVVVINSSSAAGSPEWRDAARPRMEEMAARVRAEGTDFMKQTRLYPAHSKRLDPHTRELLTRDFDRILPAGIAGTAEGLVIDVNAYERHPNLQVPLLLVVGEKDADFAPSAEAFLSRFPQHLVREVRLPEAGHAANTEQPREFEAAVIRFARAIRYLAPPPVPASGTNRVLTALGGSLVVGGLGLLVAALMFNGGDDGDDTDLVAAQPDATQVASPTAVTAIAGTRGPGTVAQPTIPAASSATPASSTATVPAAAATATPVPATATTRPATATPVPADDDDDEPAPTATPQATATPTVPAATATPAGPFAAISGPGSAAVGDTLTFFSASSPVADVLRTDWLLPSGQAVNHQAGVSYTFTAPGCYAVVMTSYFSDGQARTTGLNVAVGGASCN